MIWAPVLGVTEPRTYGSHRTLSIPRLDGTLVAQPENASKGVLTPPFELTQTPWRLGLSEIHKKGYPAHW